MKKIFNFSRSHALRGNAYQEPLSPAREAGFGKLSRVEPHRTQSVPSAFPRRLWQAQSSQAWERECEGFTLLELILSLSIIALIVVLIYGALRIGVRAWEKGGENVESRQRYRIVLNLIQHQLKSIYTDKIQNNGTRPFYLKGGSTSLEFISRISMVPGNSFGNVYVRYQVTSEEEKKRLAFYEKNIVLLTEETNMDGLTKEDYYELIPEMYEFEFEYLKSLPDENVENQELSWLPVWEAENEKGFPLAVRIHFQADEMSEPIYVIIPIQKNEISDRQ